jgi:hypothetical protein
MRLIPMVPMSIEYWQKRLAEKMDKKNRTGLQSKISHIFSGVPIPKKKPHSEPDKKDEFSKFQQPSAEDNKIETPVIEEKVVHSEQQDNIIEISLNEEPLKELRGDLQFQVQGNAGDLENSEKSVIEQNPAIDLPEDVFTVVHDQDFQIEAPKKAVEETYKKDSGKVSPSASDNKIPGDGKDISPEKSSAPKHSLQKSMEIGKQPNKSLAQESKSESTKSVLNKKQDIFETKDTSGVSKPYINKNQSVESVKSKNIRFPRKAPLKTAKKQQKSKAGTDKPRQYVMLVLAIVLSIVLIAVMGGRYNIFTSGSDNSSTVNPPSPPVNGAVIIGGIDIDWVQPQVYPDKIRNPFELVPDAGTSGNKNRDFIVLGISLNENGQYLALIGTENFKEGQEVNGAKIIKITVNTVEFEKDGVIWTQAIGEKGKN